MVDALRGGAPSCVSVFAGRIADTGRDPVPLMAAAVELPMPRRVFIGRIEDRMLEELILHGPIRAASATVKLRVCVPRVAQQMCSILTIAARCCPVTSFSPSSTIVRSDESAGLISETSLGSGFTRGFKSPRIRSRSPAASIASWMEA